MDGARAECGSPGWARESDAEWGAGTMGAPKRSLGREIAVWYR
jgi:hypothetical protein